MPAEEVAEKSPRHVARNSRRSSTTIIQTPARAPEDEITPEDVKNEVAVIAEGCGDPEMAHSREDGLYQSVLEAIAKGSPNAVELARGALKTKELSFPRWYA